MGILDDAIREHLELRRRHGAREDELQRIEDEAFGPPARPGDADMPEGAVEAGPGDDAEAPAEHALDASAEPVAGVDEPAEALAAEPATETHEDADLDIGDLDFDLDAPDAEPPIESVETAEHPPPIEAQDTVEHVFEDAIEEPGDAEAEGAPAGPATGEEELVEGEEVVEEDEAEGDEDVLEETPEFLRDQPEDDELWFEQGEPKDFDF
jgi:hypothetical protein